MKYLLSIVGDEEAWASRPPEVAARRVAQHTAVMRELEAAGKLVGSHRLRPSREAATLRRRAGECELLDGPFAETREQLGGFYLIEAASREEALGWAERLGLDDASNAIEVRPAMTGAQWRGTLRGKHKYAILLVQSRESLARQTPERVFRAIDHHFELSLDLAARGRFVGARSLGSDAGAATLRLRKGAMVVTDGPFAETRELVAGYFVVACDSKDEAVEVARALFFELDAVEVRPVWETP